MGIFEKKYLSQLDSDGQRYLEAVKNATQRMTILIKSLLSYSQVGHHKDPININCKDLINEVISDLESLITETHTKVVIGTMPTLFLYETEMRQLFQNLLTNSIKFQKKGTAPIIKISALKLKKDNWQFTVSDNGIGIGKTHFKKIFEIFERLHGHSVYEGTGIGLANCKKIVQLHQGEIWLDSVLGVGSDFHFTIKQQAS